MENKNSKVFKTKNGRIILKSTCSVYNNKKSMFISNNEGSGLLSSLGIRNALSKIPLLDIFFKYKKYFRKTYCLVCKTLTDNIDSKTVKNKGRLMMKSIYSVCGNKKKKFISQGSGLLDSLGLNTPQNRMKNDLWNAFR